MSRQHWDDGRFLWKPGSRASHAILRMQLDQRRLPAQQLVLLHSLHAVVVPYLGKLLSVSAVREHRVRSS